MNTRFSKDVGSCVYNPYFIQKEGTKMTRKMFNLTILLLFVVSFFGCSNIQMEGSIEGPMYLGSSNDKKVDNQLQEQCGKKCQELFKKTYGDEIDKTGISTSYQSHYNKKLNKCFFSIIQRRQRYLYKELYDLDENKSYGIFMTKDEDLSPSYCSILKKTCKSGKEWDVSVKPYMEE